MKIRLIEKNIRPECFDMKNGTCRIIVFISTYNQIVVDLNPKIQHNEL